MFAQGVLTLRTYYWRISDLGSGRRTTKAPQTCFCILSLQSPLLSDAICTSSARRPIDAGSRVAEPVPLGAR